MSLPRITVVTHTLGASQHLEQTIRSVIDQAYESIEYIVCEAGSDDSSADLLKAYDSRFTSRISGTGLNTSQAINKALAGATGELHCIINSGDELEQGSLRAAADAFGKGHRWITGWSQIVEADGNQWPHLPRPHGAKIDWLTYNPLRWQTSFWSAKLTSDLGGFAQDLSIAFEYDFSMRLALDAKVVPHVLRRCMGTFRVPRDYLNPAQDDPYELEAAKVQEKYWHRLSPSEQRLVRQRRARKEPPVVLTPM